jgi:hypothetical protein
MLNVLDEFSHECLAIRVARKLKAIDVIEVLSDLSILRGVLAHIRSDEGPEFVRQDHLHRRGGPWENGYIEKFNARLRDELLNGEIFYFARGVVVAQCRLAVSTALSHSRPTRAKIKRQTLTGTGRARGGTMSRPMKFFVPTILVVPIITILSTAQPSLAEPAADECKTVPGSSAPSGSHWYYRISRADQRRCWFLGPEGMKVRSQAREVPSSVSSPTRTPGRENAVEPTRAKPVETAQKTSLEGASAESRVADFAAPSADLPKTPDLETREPTTINDNYAEAREPTDAQEEMPLIWPVLTEAAPAGLGEPARESAPGVLFLIGALAMVLLCAGAIFKLARRHTQSVRRHRRMVPRRPNGVRPGQAVRADMNEATVRSKNFARKSPAATRQRPSSIDSAHDIKASLRKIMDDLQRVAA